MNNSLERFQDLLRELFQFDWADLDFGIYRILNYKREQVEEFITSRLPQIVDKAFGEYVEAEKTALRQELDRLGQQIRRTLGDGALDAQGRLKPEFRETPLGKQYLEVQEKAQGVHIAEGLKTRVYNDLYAFFSRYYEDGDFVSKRLHRRNETYAIPYSGEEVVLHWANKDQYYIKTGEHFKTYRFQAGDFTVAFELRSATVEQNGKKGNKRFFVLAQQDAVNWQPDTKTLTVFFEYRPPTEEEEQTYGRTVQQKPQDRLNEVATQTVLGQVPDVTLKERLAREEQRSGKKNTVLGWRLNHYTRRNTTDFFIHKDLKGFLLRELDFFLKNEVLLLDELIAADEDLGRHVQRARVVRRVAEDIIDFLAQVEEFQKRLFEKKKFVVRTEYCLTLDRLPEQFWGEVLANKEQVAEWQELYALEDLLKQAGKKKLDKAFVRAQPTLGVDTRHFPEDFKWRLLAHFEDLDDAIDGVVIKSENFQALNLLRERYRERVRCIYIDPPYNTGSDEFIYKDNYQHSCWLSMMADRLALAREVLAEDGVIFISIDDHEAKRLRFVMDHILGRENFLAQAIWQKVYSPRMDAKGYSQDHDYILVYRRTDRFAVERIRFEQNISQFSEVDEQTGKRYRRRSLRKEGKNSRRIDRPNLFYPLIAPDGTEVLPIRPDGSEGCWRWAIRRYEEAKKKGMIEWIKPGNGWQVYVKQFYDERATRPPSTVWLHTDVGHSHEAADELKAIFGEMVFDNPKPTRLIRRMLEIGTLAEQEAVVLDFFAGSGTTAHAVINLNQQVSADRQYILVEMGDWFETVLVPRIKKVVFCEKWKVGKPVGGEGVSHFVKVLYLEQYEDTLNNLELPREQEGQLALETFGDEYLLQYMLEFETQGSPCLLNVDMLQDPFAYRLKVREGDQIVERTVDLVDTFNYLLGVRVKKMQAFEEDGHPYRAVLGEKEGRRVAIVWRPVSGLEDDEAALLRDRQFIEQTILPALLPDSSPDRLLVNGPCLAKGTEAIEPVFKRLMFAGVA